MDQNNKIKLNTSEEQALYKQFLDAKNAKDDINAVKIAEEYMSSVKYTGRKMEKYLINAYVFNKDTKDLIKAKRLLLHLAFKSEEDHLAMLGLLAHFYPDEDVNDKVVLEKLHEIEKWPRPNLCLPIFIGSYYLYGCGCERDIYKGLNYYRSGLLNLTKYLIASLSAVEDKNEKLHKNIDELFELRKYLNENLRCLILKFKNKNIPIDHYQNESVYKYAKKLTTLWVEDGLTYQQGKLNKEYVIVYYCDVTYNMAFEYLHRFIFNFAANALAYKIMVCSLGNKIIDIVDYEPMNSVYFNRVFSTLDKIIEKAECILKKYIDKEGQDKIWKNK